MKTIYSSCVWKDRYQKPYKKRKIDWFLIITLTLMLVIVAGWYLYIETGSLGIVTEGRQGGWVVKPHLAQDTHKWLNLFLNQQAL